MLYQFLLGAAGKEGGVWDGVGEIGLEEVLPQSCRWLVGHLDSVLEHRDWELGNRGMKTSLLHTYVLHTAKPLSLSISATALFKLLTYAFSVFLLSQTHKQSNYVLFSVLLMTRFLTWMRRCFARMALPLLKPPLSYSPLPTIYKPCQKGMRWATAGSPDERYQERSLHISSPEKASMTLLGDSSGGPPTFRPGHLPWSTCLQWDPERDTKFHQNRGHFLFLTLKKTTTWAMYNGLQKWKRERDTSANQNTQSEAKYVWKFTHHLKTQLQNQKLNLLSNNSSLIYKLHSSNECRSLIK